MPVTQEWLDMMRRVNRIMWGPKPLTADDHIAAEASRQQDLGKRSAAPNNVLAFPRQVEIKEDPPMRRRPFIDVWYLRS